MLSIKDWIKSYEAFTAYPCLNTNGTVTIGFGRVLDDKGISEEEGMYLFDNDFSQCKRDLCQYSWYADKPTHVQAALINMYLSVGLHGLFACTTLFRSLNEEDYTNAALSILESPWAQIYPKRAKDVALMMREGCQ